MVIACFTAKYNIEEIAQLSYYFIIYEVIKSVCFA